MRFVGAKGEKLILVFSFIITGVNKEKKIYLMYLIKQHCYKILVFNLKKIKSIIISLLLQPVLFL